jgi:predicted  nucleic acid-binding Zn-ribbon protein
MSITVPSFAEVAPQFETATAQLRGLTALSEAQRDGDLKETVNELERTVVKWKVSVTGVETKMKEVQSEVQSVRDRSEAQFKKLEFA